MLLLEKVEQAQRGNEEAMLKLILQFSPLMKKYGRKLGYEDATEDLIADFVSAGRKQPIMAGQKSPIRAGRV